ncbi:MAG: DUF1697 domain-containing protein [Rhodobacteraceae bacterium]|nr:DUF1697 domain-containing protein [Paracoccaceae bacterium]
MAVWIALLRGINVGGRNKVPMQALRDVIERCGGRNVKTYIQSGNLVFMHEEDDAIALKALLEDAIAFQFGFPVPVLALPLEQFEELLSFCPYASKPDAEKNVHCFIYLESPMAKEHLDDAVDLAALDRVAAEREEFTLRQNVFYLYAPDGIGRSKLVAQLGRLLGVSTTARNFKTMRAIADLAGDFLPN